MALKSAKTGHLRIPEHTFPDAKRFLDFVQSDGGSRYGYDNRGATPPMTAIGLLCRMYLGWMRDNPALEQGVEFLSQKGPSPEDIYYDYYATQVLHHWGGPEWKKWNQVLRDHLIETQVKDGDAAGSWKPTGDRGAGARRPAVSDLSQRDDAGSVLPLSAPLSEGTRGPQKVKTGRLRDRVLSSASSLFSRSVTGARTCSIDRRKRKNLS